MNLSSLIVDVRPERLGAVRTALLEWPGVEVRAATPQGKLVIVIEASNDSQSTDTFARIGAVGGVMSVALVFHQFEPDPDQEVPHGTDPT